MTVTTEYNNAVTMQIIMVKAIFKLNFSANLKLFNY